MNTSYSRRGRQSWRPALGDTTKFSYPANAKELPKRNSPLARDWVAIGHYYDETTGLVKPITTKKAK